MDIVAAAARNVWACARGGLVPPYRLVSAQPAIRSTTADDADSKNVLSSGLSSGLNRNDQNDLQSADDTDGTFFIAAAHIAAGDDGDDNCRLSSPLSSPVNLCNHNDLRQGDDGDDKNIQTAAMASSALG